MPHNRPALLPFQAINFWSFLDEVLPPPSKTEHKPSAISQPKPGFQHLGRNQRIGMASNLCKTAQNGTKVPNEKGGRSPKMIPCMVSLKAGIQLPLCVSFTAKQSKPQFLPLDRLKKPFLFLFLFWKTKTLILFGAVPWLSFIRRDEAAWSRRKSLPFNTFWFRQLRLYYILKGEKWKLTCQKGAVRMGGAPNMHSARDNLGITHEEGPPWGKDGRSTWVKMTCQDSLCLGTHLPNILATSLP